MTIHQDELLASINRAYQVASTPELQRALNELSAATSRCETLDDIAYVRSIFYDVRAQDPWRHRVVSNMSSASLRLEHVKRRSS